MDDQNRPQSRAARGGVQLTAVRRLLYPVGGGGEVQAGDKRRRSASEAVKVGGSRRRPALGAAKAGGSRRKPALGSVKVGGGAQRLAPRMAKANVATAPAVRA
jgi:hypothetical protein